MPHFGWVGFDPTNRLVAGERHIRTAIGRDYADVPPTHGMFRGRAKSELTVAVRVTPSEGTPSMDQELPVPEGLVDPRRKGAGAAGYAAAAEQAAADGAAAAVELQAPWLQASAAHCSAKPELLDLQRRADAMEVHAVAGGGHHGSIDARAGGEGLAECLGLRLRR